MEARWQKNITLSNEQVDFIKSNLGKMNVREISKILNVGYNKVHKNLRLMGKVKIKNPKVIKMDNCFDIDMESKKYYSY